MICYRFLWLVMLLTFPNTTGILDSTSLATMKGQGRGEQESTQRKVAKAVYGNRLDELAAIVAEAPNALELRDSTGFMAVHFAAEINSLEIIKFISKKAPKTLMSQTQAGDTPALLAAWYDSVECLQFLAGPASDSLKTKRRNGLTAAHVAASKGYAQCLQILATHAPETLRSQEAKGNTPAHVACAVGAVDCVIVLKAYLKQEDWAFKNNDGKTPLDLARGRDRSVCDKVLRGGGLSTRDLGRPEKPDWAPLVAKPSAARLAERWISLRVPELQLQKTRFAYRPPPSHTSVAVLGGGFWDLRPKAKPPRLMFFTSRRNPLKDLSELDPRIGRGQFAVWDSSLVKHAFYFLAKADLVSPEERKGYPIWLLGDGNFPELFAKRPGLRLFMTYSIHEGTIRKSGGIPVRFATNQ